MFPKTRAAILQMAFLLSLSAALGPRPAGIAASYPEEHQQPVAIFRPKPEYPYEARAGGMTGSGVVALTIDGGSGNVTAAMMARSIGSPILDNSAVSAFRRWRFKTGTRGKVYVPIAFTTTGANVGSPTTEFNAQHDAPAPPNRLAETFAIIMRTYPNANPRWFVHPPADKAWIFSAFNPSVGTVEVGFQGDQILYMIFRRGVGGFGWKPQEIAALHNGCCKELLKEHECGDAYTSRVVPQINAAIITRRDFDANKLF